MKKIRQIGRISRISRIGRIGPIAGLLLAAVAAAWAATTTYTAPPPAGSRRDWATNRYASEEQGFLVVDVTTSDINDVTLALDTALAGYLQRVVYSHDGNDSSYKLYIKDAAGIAIYSDTDANAVNDPCSAVCSYGTGGVPFLGGLSIQIADANQARVHYAGDGNNVTVRLYIREAWRR